MSTRTKNRANYLPKPGARLSRQDARLLGQIIFERHRGNITAQQLVDEARPNNSLIHHLFEWDNSKAAEKYRLEQARHHIRHIHVEIVRNRKRSSVRALHHVTVSRTKPLDTPRYVDFRNIRRDPSQIEEVIGQALQELRGWQRRYRQYQAIFREVFEVIDNLSTDQVKKRAR